MRNALLAILVTSAAFASNASSSSAAPIAMSGDKAEASIPALTVDEVEQQITTHQLTAVDVNGDATRKRLGLVPGAIRLSDDESFAPSELPGDKSTKLVFYCRSESCHACHGAARRAKSLGYTNVYVMPAGIAGWKKAGKQTEAG